jgi:hypothetical protein
MGSGSGLWYDTPAEAIANPPTDQPPVRNAGQRPPQSSLGSEKGPTLPEGAGGPAVPPAHGRPDDAKEKNGKHKP